MKYRKLSRLFVLALIGVLCLASCGSGFEHVYDQDGTGMLSVQTQDSEELTTSDTAESETESGKEPEQSNESESQSTSESTSESESASESTSESDSESESISEPTSESESESESESSSESLGEDRGIVVALLERNALPSFNAYKLLVMEGYYQRYYVGELPHSSIVADTMLKLYNTYFGDEIDSENESDVTDALLACYQQAVGDKYAIYMDKEDLAAIKEDFGAEYTGIGIYVSYDALQNTMQILNVYENTPAMNAGMMPGDYIVAVDGKTVEELGYYELVNRMRGEAGTSVTVTVLRDGRELSFTMVRKQLMGISVTYRRLSQDTSIGYVKIEQFDAHTAEQFKAAIDALEASGVTALVFDLRNNGGGQLGAIVSVLDYLLSDGLPIAHMRYKPGTGNEDAHYFAEDGHSVSLPMTVLCNEYTASAAELFTAALRDHGKATIVGSVTYGKGTAQAQLEPFGDGTGFTISIARYDPPIGQNYEGIGITPDISVTLSEEAAKVNAFLRDDAIDNQLQAAVTELNRLRASNLNGKDTFSGE